MDDINIFKKTLDALAGAITVVRLSAPVEGIWFVWNHRDGLTNDSVAQFPPTIHGDLVAGTLSHGMIQPSDWSDCENFEGFK